jgi:radical SAM protein with 4Fe4S-binding SPASM domain
MGDAKVSVTTKCNAKCKTCPVWKLPSDTMSFGRFQQLIKILNDSNKVDRILLNNTGDLYNIPDHVKYLTYVERHMRKPVIMTTNAGLMDYVPTISSLIISFNGGNKEAYEYTTGVDFDETVKRIREAYPMMRKVPSVEMHCLIWDGNAESEKDLLDLWDDFPGRIRVSYKYDNQHEEDHTLEEYKTDQRIPCDYLSKNISIMPTGQVVACAHDFKRVTNFGNVFEDDIEAILWSKERREMLAKHNKGIFDGLCENCNYNTLTHGKIKYLR